MPLANPPTVFELYGHFEERSVTSLPAWIREDDPFVSFSPRPFPVIHEPPVLTRGPADSTPPAGDNNPIVDLTTIFGPLFPPSEGPPASLFDFFHDLFGWG